MKILLQIYLKRKKDDANVPPVPQGGESKKEGFFSKFKID